MPKCPKNGPFAALFHLEIGQFELNLGNFLDFQRPRGCDSPVLQRLSEGDLLPIGGIAVFRGLKNPVFLRISRKNTHFV